MSRSTPFAFLVLLAATLSLSACKQPEPDPRTEPPLVRTALAQAPRHEARSFTGIVSARVQSELGFRVAGKVTARLVDTGQAVKRGQPLMKLDATDFALATNAQVAAVAGAKAKALQTAADEKRYRGLVSAGAVSASAYDQMKAAADAAQAQLDAALAQADVIRNQAGYSVLVADADGIVVETLAEPGQVVAAAETVVRLAHAGPREATINLPESLRPAIGSTARASLYGERTVVGTARLRQLSDAADARTRTFDARYVLEGAAATAPLGTTVTIALADASAASAMQVPLSAITDNGQGPGVWVVKGDDPSVEWRPVQLNALGAETATVTSGLAAGDRFVSLGAHLLHAGERVRLATR
ncbi:efflux RND transporter periplasmic adaptor subunit [soil metagenome]